MMNPYPPRSDSAKPFTVSKCHETFFSQPLPGEPIDQRAASRPSSDRFFRAESAASSSWGGGRSSSARGNRKSEGEHAANSSDDCSEYPVHRRQKKWDGSIGENTTFSNPRHITENDIEELRREKENRQPFQFMERRSRPVFHEESSDEELSHARRPRKKRRRKILVHNGAVAEGSRPSWSYSNIPEKKLVPDWIPENGEWLDDEAKQGGSSRKPSKKPTVRSILRGEADDQPTPSPRATGQKNETLYNRPRNHAHTHGAAGSEIPRPPLAARPGSAAATRPPVAAPPPRRPQSATTRGTPQKQSKQPPHPAPPQPPQPMVYKGGGIWEPATNVNTNSNGKYYSGGQNAQPPKRTLVPTAQFKNQYTTTNAKSPYLQQPRQPARQAAGEWSSMSISNNGRGRKVVTLGGSSISSYHPTPASTSYNTPHGYQHARVLFM